MSAQLIPLAVWTDGAWIDLAGNPYEAPSALADNASFVASTVNGITMLDLLISGDESAADCNLIEVRCEECGAYMRVGPPKYWTPAPVFVRCDECCAKDSTAADRDQQLAEEFAKAIGKSR